MPLDPSLLLSYGKKERLRTLLSLRGQSLSSDDEVRLDAGTELYASFWRGLVAHGTKYDFASPLSDDVASRLGARDVPFLERPLWIEIWQRPLITPIGKVSRLFGYNPHREYDRWGRAALWRNITSKEEEEVVKYVTKYILSPPGSFVLEVFHTSPNIPLCIMQYHGRHEQWEYAYPHICPLGACVYRPPDKSQYRPLQLCQQCTEALALLPQWFSTAYDMIKSHTAENEKKHEVEKPVRERKKRTKEASSVVKNPGTSKASEQTMHANEELSSPNVLRLEEKDAPLSGSPLSSPSVSPTASSPVQRPVIVTHPLLIDRYRRAHQGRGADMMAQAEKYLWMHSAWLMAEALRLGGDDKPLRVPADPVYIELEQERILHGQRIAAFLFFPKLDQDWVLSVLGDDGQTVWSLFYEKQTWTLPQDYGCPESQCTTQETERGRVYHLCPLCQQRLGHYTTWIAIALRMLAGDFREQVELREPEFILETSTDEMQEDKGNQQRKPQLYRYRVIQYFDACRYTGKSPQTRRGSWMTGKPLAESEYDVNLDALIYVIISPKEHDRNYRHERFVRMRGKTQHIEPNPRLQPMTIATLRQLKQRQPITHVLASRYTTSSTE